MRKIREFPVQRAYTFWGHFLISPKATLKLRSVWWVKKDEILSKGIINAECEMWKLR
jgi:hypothetical protein